MPCLSTLFCVESLRICTLKRVLVAFASAESIRDALRGSTHQAARVFREGSCKDQNEPRFQQIQGLLSFNGTCSFDLTATAELIACLLRGFTGGAPGYDGRGKIFCLLTSSNSPSDLLLQVKALVRAYQERIKNNPSDTELLQQIKDMNAKLRAHEKVMAESLKTSVRDVTSQSPAADSADVRSTARCHSHSKMQKKHGVRGLAKPSELFAWLLRMPSPHHRKQIAASLQQLADGGSTEALDCLAKLYFAGLDTVQVDSGKVCYCSVLCSRCRVFQAYQIALQAFEASQLSAAFVVAGCATDVLGKAAGEAKAREVLKAAPADDPFIVYRWLFLDEKETTPERARAAAESLQKLADDGDCFAQFCTGVLHEKGKGLKKDKRSAAQWFRKAAEQGHAQCQFRLASMLLHGQGVDRNEKLAVEWFGKAAEQGHANSQFELARMLADKDEYEAVRWLRRAAEQGMAEAQRHLAARLENGRGVEENVKQAAHWYRKAAEQGDRSAALQLARLTGTQQLLHSYSQRNAATAAAEQPSELLSQLLCSSSPTQRKRLAASLRKLAEGGSAEALECLAKIHAFGLNALQIDYQQVIARCVVRHLNFAPSGFPACFASD